MRILHLDAGSALTVPLLVKPSRQRFVGQNIRYDFEIAASPVGGSASQAQVVPGEQHRPGVPLLQQTAQRPALVVARRP